MLNKKPRVAGIITKFLKKEISSLFKNAKTICRTSGLSLKYDKITNLTNIKYTHNNIGRILILIPKKVGSAPIRNKIRRRIKQIFYQEKMHNHGYNFIIYFNKKTSNINYDYLKDFLLKCLKRIL